MSTSPAFPWFPVVLFAPKPPAGEVVWLTAIINGSFPSSSRSRAACRPVPPMRSSCCWRTSRVRHGEGVVVRCCAACSHLCGSHFCVSCVYCYCCKRAGIKVSSLWVRRVITRLDRIPGSACSNLTWAKVTFYWYLAFGLCPMFGKI